MDAKTYRVKSMRQALELIRQELGPEASVLHSRRVRRAGVSGWLTGQTELEVVASTTVDVPSRFPTRPPENPGNTQPNPAPPAATAPKSPVGAPIEPSRKNPSSHIDQESVPPIRAESPPTQPTAPEEPELFDSQTSLSLSQARSVEQVTEKLCQAGFESQQVDQALAALRADHFDFAQASIGETIDEALIELADLAKIGGPFKWQPGHSHWVAFVGPTGVGKTTTIAKLAASLARDSRFSVGLVTADTGRVGGSDQLAAYAEVFQLPITIVQSPEEMQQAMPRLTEQHDLVLIDTGGYSPRQTETADRLRQILAVARPDETQLVVSGSMSQNTIRAVGEQFRPLGLSGVVLTKLDETPALQDVWPAMQELQLPINYLTCGQRIPEDIEGAGLQRLALWLKRGLHWPEAEGEVEFQPSSLHAA